MKNIKYVCTTFKNNKEIHKLELSDNKALEHYTHELNEMLTINCYQVSKLKNKSLNNMLFTYTVKTTLQNYDNTIIDKYKYIITLTYDKN